MPAETWGCDSEQDVILRLQLRMKGKTFPVRGRHASPGQSLRSPLPPAPPPEGDPFLTPAGISIPPYNPFSARALPPLPSAGFGRFCRNGQPPCGELSFFRLSVSCFSPALLHSLSASFVFSLDPPPGGRVYPKKEVMHMRFTRILPAVRAPPGRRRPITRSRGLAPSPAPGKRLPGIHTGRRAADGANPPAAPA